MLGDAADEEAPTIPMDREGWRSSKRGMVDSDLSGDSTAPKHGKIFRMRLGSSQQVWFRDALMSMWATTWQSTRLAEPHVGY
jgi:hypothetical protein